MKLSLRTAARIAWRETRSSLTKFLFVVLAVAAGVGALSGVRGFSESFHATLTSEARTVMAGDLSARQFQMPTDSQVAALDALADRGVEHTWITETVSMAEAKAGDATPVLAALKAVDPAHYPYYGEMKLEPEMPLQEALRPDTVVAGEDLLIRLHLKPGDTVKVGTQDFRIAATIVSEPDRMSASLNIGLRMMMSREAFARTGLMQLGSRASERYLFKLEPNAPPVEEVRRTLRRILPDAMVIDFRQSNPIITDGLDQATTFLSLISLIAMIVGAIGVAMAMHAHLQQKMDNIAVMKSIGATSNEIIRIYTLQTLMLGMVGGLAGVAVGRVVEQVFPLLIQKYFSVAAALGWHFAAAGQGIAVGVLTTLLFTLPPLLAIRRIRPAMILRRNMPEAKFPWQKRLVELRAALATGGFILIGIGAIAAWLAGSRRVGAYFAGGLTGSLIALAAVAWLMLRLVRALLRGSPWRIPSLVRQGMANLYRQGNQAQAILVALGLGVMFTLTVYLVQDSLVAQIIDTAPPGAPNVYLVGVTGAQVDALKGLIAHQTGVMSPAVFVPRVAARITAVNGEEVAGRRRGALTVMFETDHPENLHVVEGAWWKRDALQPDAAPVVSVNLETAKRLGVKPGDWIEVESAGRNIRARVVALHEWDEKRFMPTSAYVFNPPALAGLPVAFDGGVRIEKSQVAAFQRAAFEKFPTVTVVNIADALEIVQQVIDQIALVIRFLSAFAILAGAIILAASVAGTRFRRIREVVILKTLGATRQHVARIFSVEFLTLGAVAGLMGGILATIFSSLVLKRLLNAHFELDPKALAGAVVLTALLANASGWLASFRILRQKPLEVLREE
ncbi:MAG TPA: FtsX-like permease family protein [Bryobacteraceae bacterium]|nr:FtsX-like permease family protein [Bryobacteraceae bacterium]